MLKKLGLVAVSVLLLSGCGSGDSGNDGISNKKYVVVLQSVESGICESSLFRDKIQSEGLENIITEETNIDTTCSTYGKSNNGNECAMEYVGGGNRNCVIGFDSINGRGKQAKLTGDLNLYDIAETIFNEVSKE